MIGILEQKHVINNLSEVNDIVDEILKKDETNQIAFSVMTQVYESVRLTNAILTGYSGNGSIKEVNEFMQDNKASEVHDMSYFNNDLSKKLSFLENLTESDKLKKEKLSKNAA